jgi:hypothetical protein
MSTASLELCKELYELSGWQADNAIFGELLPNEKGFKRPIIAYEYDLGYLLRKLGDGTDIIYHEAESDAASIHGIRAKGDTPEDAIAKLCIELFRQGFLK